MSTHGRRAEPADEAREAQGRHGRVGRWFAWGGWGLVILAFGAGVSFCCAVAGSYLSLDLLPRLLHADPVIYGLPAGFAAGIAITCWFGHRGRHWVMRWRLWRLRRTGVCATASITHVDRDVFFRPRGGNHVTYTLKLRWTDPGDGEVYVLDRHYRYLGSKGSPEFEKAIRAGQTVPVAYPPGRPWRLVADTPYAPPMSELLTGGFVP